MLVVSLKGRVAKTNSLAVKRQSYNNSLSWWLSQLRVAVARSEKLVAEAGDISGTQRKWNARHWKQLPNNG
jgi:hypothetical protein